MKKSNKGISKYILWSITYLLLLIGSAFYSYARAIDCYNYVEDCSFSSDYTSLSSCYGACNPTGGTCEYTGNCCDGYNFQNTYRCEPPPLPPCKAQGDTCSDSTQCCGGFVCDTETSSCQDTSASNFCSPAGKKDTWACGNCGTQTRTCQEGLTWGSWGSCTGSGSCSAGSTRPCAGGGTETCSSTCNWGSCVGGTGSGTCNCNGFANQGCGVGGCAANQMYQTRTCTDSGTGATGCSTESTCVYDVSCGAPTCDVGCNGNVPGWYDNPNWGTCEASQCVDGGGNPCAFCGQALDWCDGCRFRGDWSSKQCPCDTGTGGPCAPGQVDCGGGVCHNPCDMGFGNFNDPDPCDASGCTLECTPDITGVLPSISSPNVEFTITGTCLGTTLSFYKGIILPGGYVAFDNYVATGGRSTYGGGGKSAGNFKAGNTYSVTVNAARTQATIKIPNDGFFTPGSYAIVNYVARSKSPQDNNIPPPQISNAFPFTIVPPCYARWRESRLGPPFTINWGVPTDATDRNNCCPSPDNCVYNGVCYSPGSVLDLRYLGFGLDAVIKCGFGNDGRWYDVDSVGGECNSASLSWMPFGMTPLPEYGSAFDGGDGTTECCGDDDLEYNVTTAGITRCCDSPLSCVDSSGNCQDGNELCGDGVDNDCDNNIDCQDPECAGIPGPTGSVCCTSSANCIQDDCALESCVAGVCQSSNRPRCDATECAVGQYCVTPGGNCGTTSELCLNGVDDDCDGLIDCPDPDCAGLPCSGCSTPPCTSCQPASVAANCGNTPCVNEQCVSNACTFTTRAVCDATDCPLGQYCNPSATCQTPDSDSTVCTNCVADATIGVWNWPGQVFQDAGKAYNANLFNSDGAPCPAASCSKASCSCYDSFGNPVNHLGPLATGSCCGDDASEHYKPDYYGPECVSDVNHCVWSDGNAQASGSGNAEYWCYNTKWDQCTNGIIGSITQAGAMCCAGTAANNAWTRSAAVLGENSYSCSDGIDNDCDGVIDCQDTNCAGQPGPLGVRCCQVVTDCLLDDCVSEACNANSCAYVNRTLGDGTECVQTGTAGTSSYCNATAGDCKLADSDLRVCNFVSDTTPINWTWNNGKPTRDGMIDAGKIYSPQYFDSANSACTAGSCNTSNTHLGRLCNQCYDSNSVTNTLNRVSSIPTGNCCGDDTGEYMKSDYYGPECVSSPDNCVWSDGQTQAPNSGNSQWWCNPGDWFECNNANIGNHDPPVGMCCAGVVNNNAWTPNASVSPEDTLAGACSDLKDNDCDGLIDCLDPDCGGIIEGNVRNQNNNAVSLVNVNAREGVNLFSGITDGSGYYNLPMPCGTYDVSVSHPDYWPASSLGVVLNPNQVVRRDFNLLLGTSCEADCTFVSDDIIHAECEGHAGCTFCDSTSKGLCDNAKVGWLRDYDALNYVICPSGCPQPKLEEQPSLSCSSGTIVKITRIVFYNGKPVKLVVATCG